MSVKEGYEQRGAAETTALDGCNENYKGKELHPSNPQASLGLHSPSIPGHGWRQAIS